MAAMEGDTDKTSQLSKMVDFSCMKNVPQRAKHW